MSGRFKASYLTLCLLSLASTARAEPLTRRAALERALAQSPQIAASRAREDAARARGERVDAARYPELTLDVGTGPGLKAKLAPGSAIASTENAYGDVGLNDLTLFVGAQARLVQPLYTFGKIGLRDEAATHERLAREAQTRMTRSEVALEVAKLYEGLWFARDAQLFFEEAEHMLDGAIDSTRERIQNDNADTSERELLQLVNAKSFARLQLNRARAAAREAEGGLVAYLGLAEGTAIELPEGELEPIATTPGELAAWVQTAQQNRPELTALAEGVAALRALADAKEAGALPDLFALGFVSAAYTPDRDLVDTRYAVDPQKHFVPGVLLGMRWSWQAGRASAEASEHRAEASELEHTRRWAVTGIPAQVEVALEDARRALSDHDESARAVDQAKRWVVMAMADNTIGLADSRAVVDAFEAYGAMRVSHIEATYRYNVAMAQLAAATGTLDLRQAAPYPGAPPAPPKASPTPPAPPKTSPTPPTTPPEPTEDAH